LSIIVLLFVATIGGLALLTEDGDYGSVDSSGVVSCNKIHSRAVRTESAGSNTVYILDVLEGETFTWNPSVYIEGPVKFCVQSVNPPRLFLMSPEKYRSWASLVHWQGEWWHWGEPKESPEAALWWFDVGKGSDFLRVRSLMHPLE